MITATTLGLGPFYPAVRWNGELFIHPDQFTTEDEAIVLANELVGAIKNEIELTIIQHHFIYVEKPNG
jgi:hypothetical protein